MPAVKALSDADLDRLIDGKMPTAEWQRHLHWAQEQHHALIAGIRGR